MSEQFVHALEFATRAHDGQLRKDGITPYIVHPLNVSARVLRESGDFDIASAAVLHDVVEDCGVTLDALEDGWGPKVATLVDWVSEKRNGEPTDKNWRERKVEYIEQLRFAPVPAQLIALCDKHDNLTDLLRGVHLDGRAAFNRLRVGRGSQLWYHDTLLTLFTETNFPGSILGDYTLAVEQLRAT